MIINNYRKCLCHCDTFSAGISNGAEWYLVDNGMQDFNYLFSNCLEVTAELSCWKRPPSHHLQVEWENNLDSMLVVLETVHCGVKGKVTVAETGEPLDRAAVEVVGRDKQVVTTHRSDLNILSPSLSFFFLLSTTLCLPTSKPICVSSFTENILCRFRGDI